MRRIVLVSAILIAGCGTEQIGPGEQEPKPAPAVLTAAVVSLPVPVPAGAALLAEANAYVSLPPGTFPSGLQAEIRNRRTGATATTPFSDGGWDPIPVAAQLGDTLGFTILTAGAAAQEFIAIVGGRKRPVVVRTNPPPGKRDVPLNATLLVVFSEPMDPATINGNSIQLRRDGVLVPGVVEQPAGAPWTAELTPAALEAGTTYQLVLTRGATNLSAESLDAEVVVSFTTVVGLGLTGRLAFSRDDGDQRHIQVMDLVSGVVTQLTSGAVVDRAPRWSPGGDRIAFQRNDSVVNVYVMNDDGSGVRKLGEGYSPAWSRDSTGRIAFLTYSGSAWTITIVNADGSGAARMIGLPPIDHVGSLSWSPDGRTFFFDGVDFDQGYLPLAMQEEWWALIRIDADGSNLRRADHCGGNCNFPESGPVLSPDGAWIAFNRSMFGLSVRTSDGGQPTTVWSSPVLGGAWSPDALMLVTPLNGVLHAIPRPDRWAGRSLVRIPGTEGIFDVNWGPPR